MAGFAFALGAEEIRMADVGAAHAVVLGSGIAGLLAARVLSEFHQSVTVVERDVLPDCVEQRKGVPQGRHLHNLLSRGTQIIGDLFPGLLDELAAAGAVVDTSSSLGRIYIRAGRYELNPAGRLAVPEPLAAYQASRPFIEFHLRRRVAALSNVAFLDNHDFVEPVYAGESVTGVRITNRDTGISAVLNAALVVDATGGATRTPQLLEAHAFGVPEEERVPSIGGYSSQLLQVPRGRITERLAFINPGGRVPGALLVAYEQNHWMLAIFCPTGSGNPPRSFAEMMQAAEGLLPAHIMAGLRDATPVGEVSISRSTSATWRRYDRMPQLPSGMVVLGDALCSLNPLHGQGMTTAALQALTLRKCLQDGGSGLPQRFYAAAAADIGPVWAANRANDRAPSAGEAPTVPRRLRSWAQRAALRAAGTDIVVAERFLRVRGLIDPPSRLRDPALLLRILLANLRATA